MADRESSCVSYSGLVEKYIGSAYDVVYAVYLALGDIKAVADLLTGFGVIYYGVKQTVPLTRNDGSPRQEGDMYFNDSTKLMYVFNAGEWIALGAVSTETEITTISSVNRVGNDTVIDINVGYRVGLNNIIVYVNGVHQFGQGTHETGSYIETDQDQITFPNLHLIDGDIVAIIIGTPITTVNPVIGVETERYLTESENQQVITIPNDMEYIPGNDNLTVHLAGLMQYAEVDYFETDKNTITFANPIPDIQTQVIFRKGNLVTNYSTVGSGSGGSDIRVYDLGTDFNANYAIENTNDAIYLKAYEQNDGKSGNYIYDFNKSRSTADGLFVNDSSVDIPSQGTGVGLGCWIKQDIIDSYQQLHFMVHSGTGTQAIPVHDGLVGTEIVLDLPDFNNSDIAINAAGHFTILREIDLSQSILQLAVQKSGGSIAELSVWSEVSTNSGSTWTINGDSLRAVSINNDSEGLHTFELSFLGTLAVGIMYRFVMTNSGAGILSLEPPTQLSTSKGTVDGTSAKISLMYRKTGS